MKALVSTINQEKALVVSRAGLLRDCENFADGSFEAPTIAYLARPAHVPRHGAGAAAGAVHGHGDGGAERVLTNQRGGLWSRDPLSSNQSSPGPRG